MSGNTPNSPVLPGAIYTALRSSILAQLDPPGSTITEAAVADRFGVARPTARIAIDRLVTEGLLRREPHHAARVPELGRDDIADLFDVRAVVESAAAALLATSAEPPAATVEAHHALLRRSRATTGGASFTDEDIEFHRSLVLGQSSNRLARMHALIMGEVELCIAQLDSQRLIGVHEVIAQHQGILDAISDGNVDLATARTRAHIWGARDKLIARYDALHPTES
ncbi:GntR family transcriptional regulator [Glaciihabitans sp. dw_435]|uniref:GntR family transcriptional regulator n=1 Tax=Glaciihabitans sp. dw_435 TaxID=2720081 RepID=UPI001BD4D5FB|nr:GntR family transcriptional regulator [Glaciihabitans sp. dw_435]